MSAKTDLDVLRRKSKRLRWFIRVGVGVVILAVWGVAIESTVSMRHAALKNAISNASNLTASFQDELAHTLGVISSTLDTIGDRVRMQGEHFDLYSWSRENTLFKESRIVVGIVNLDGRLVATTRSPHPQPLYLGDREHIRVQLDGKAKGLYIGEPIIARSGGTVEIPISARINDISGDPLCIFSAIVPPAALIPLYTSVDLGNHGVLSLVGLDGVVRARFSRGEPSGLRGVGESVAGDPLPAAFPINATGYFIRPSIVDHIPRIYSYRRVGKYPLLVVIGFDLNDVYASATEHARIIYSLAAVVTLILIALGAYLTHEIRIRSLRELDLQIEREKLQATNRQLQDSNNRAETASRAKSMFLANMSHELRTPLNAIIGFSQIIKHQIKGPLGAPAYAQYADYIHTAGEHLHALIGDVLDIAKIEAGAIELNEESLKPSVIIREVCATLEGQAKRKRITIQIDVAAEIRNLQILGDPLRLRQVIINLVSNALKFTPERGHVSVALDYAPGSALAFVIADPGIGMTSNEIRLALEPFGQINSALSRENDGAGLGLPLARRLIELHGGRLEIDSTKGRGTTVRAIIPEARILGGLEGAQTAVA